MQAAMISFDDFLKVEMHIGTILEVKPFPKARKPAYQLSIDFGEKIGLKRSSAQITAHYEAESLVGKQVVAVTNFPPKQIATFISEVLILGVMQEDDSVILLQPERAVRNGTRIA